MRKLFWCGVLLAAMSSAAVCVVADYSTQYPDSPMSGWALAICRGAALLDPVHLFAPRMGRDAVYQVATAEPKSCPLPDGACDTTDELTPVTPLEVIDLSSLASAEIGGEEEASAPEPTDTPQAAEQGQMEAEAEEVVTVPPTPVIEEDVAIEEDPVPDTMPPAKDEDGEEACEATKMEDLIQEQIDQIHMAESAATAESEEAPMPNKAEEQTIEEVTPNDPAGSALERKLNLPINLELKETPFEQLIDDLRILLGVNIVIDQDALDKEGVARDWPISLTLYDVTAKSALDMIFGNFGLTFLVKDNMILVTSVRAAQAAVADQEEQHCPATGCGGCYPVKDKAATEDSTPEKKADSEEEHCPAGGCGGCYPVKDEDSSPEKKADTEEEHVFSFWMSLFHFDEELKSPGEELEQLPMPAEETAEDQKSDDNPAAAEEAAPPAAESTGEESEAHPGTPPDCREDPHHDQQYPGCPYMGGCPSKSCPQEVKGQLIGPPLDYDVPADDHASAFPMPIYHDRPETGFVDGHELHPYLSQKADDRPESNGVLPGSFTENTAIRRMKHEEFATPSAERPVHPDHFDWRPATPQVDTMEFRPSDAKPDEFDPSKPF